jgi:hypothetical protein
MSWLGTHASHIAQWRTTCSLPYATVRFVTDSLIGAFISRFSVTAATAAPLSSAALWACVFPLRCSRKLEADRQCSLQISQCHRGSGGRSLAGFGGGLSVTDGGDGVVPASGCARRQRCQWASSSIAEPAAAMPTASSCHRASEGPGIPRHKTKLRKTKLWQVQSSRGEASSSSRQVMSSETSFPLRKCFE